MFKLSLLRSSVGCKKYPIFCKQLKQTSQLRSLSTMGDVPKETLEKLEAGFAKLQGAADCKSLLKKHLTKEIFEELKGTKMNRFFLFTKLDPFHHRQKDADGRHPAGRGAVRHGEPGQWRGHVRSGRRGVHRLREPLQSRH